MESDVAFQFLLTEWHGVLQKKDDGTMELPSTVRREKEDILEYLASVADTLSIQQIQERVQARLEAQVHKIFETIKAVDKELKWPTVTDGQIWSIPQDIEQNYANLREKKIENCKTHLGYAVSAAPSTIANAGRGLFLHGSAMTGSVVGIFPGTVYMPEHLRKKEHMAIVSNNVYARARPDSTIIDAKNMVDAPYKNLYAMAHFSNHPEKGFCRGSLNNIALPCC